MITPRDILKLAIEHPGHKKKIIALLVDEGYPLDMLKVAMFTLEKKYEESGLKAILKYAEQGGTSLPQYDVKHRNWNGALYGKFVKENRSKSPEEQFEIWGDSWNTRSKKLTPRGRDLWESWQKKTLIEQVGKHKQISSNIARINKEREELGELPLPTQLKKPQKSNQTERPLPGQKESGKKKKRTTSKQKAPSQQSSPTQQSSAPETTAPVADSSDIDAEFASLIADATPDSYI